MEKYFRFEPLGDGDRTRFVNGEVRSGAFAPFIGLFVSDAFLVRQLEGMNAQAKAIVEGDEH